MGSAEVERLMGLGVPAAVADEIANHSSDSPVEATTGTFTDAVTAKSVTTEDDVVAGGAVVGTAGVFTAQAVTNVNDSTPSKTELTTAFGNPATKGRGFIGTVDDADGNTNMFLVVASDADYFFVKLTKAS